ncbi:MAG: hypothetical protein QOK28_1124, partial [Actinomycetota bacterium]
GACGSIAGAVANAGLNTNRMTRTENGQTTAYCYNAADQLLSSSDTRIDTPKYDDHGNTTTLGSTNTLSFRFDASDRHIGTTQGSVNVSLRRDAADRVIERVSGAKTTRYGFTGSGDTPDLELDSAGAVLERTIALPGGVILAARPAGVQVWSLPNIHGDVMVTAADGGSRTSPTLMYDPFGVFLGARPDNLSGGFDYGWLGENQRLADTDTASSYIEMGARVYLPLAGRFLQVDPVEGGSCNSYDWVCGDSINSSDLSGDFCWRCAAKAAGSWAVQNRGLIVLAVCVVGTVVACGVAKVASAAIAVGVAVQTVRNRNASGYDKAWAVGDAALEVFGAGQTLAKTGSFGGDAVRNFGVRRGVQSNYRNILSAVRKSPAQQRLLSLGVHYAFDKFKDRVRDRWRR